MNTSFKNALEGNPNRHLDYPGDGYPDDESGRQMVHTDADARHGVSVISVVTRKDIGAGLSLHETSSFTFL
jgi:hypothetical protein